MTGTKLNNNFNLAQRKPLDERQTTVATVAELSLIRYPYPNLICWRKEMENTGCFLVRPGEQRHMI